MAINAGTIMAYLDLDTTGFTHAFDDASGQLEGFAGGGIEGALGSIGAAATTAGRALTMGVTTPLLGVSAAAVGAGMEFDASMSKVASLSGATGAEFDALRNKAREMGASTIFSAKDSADAFGYMALAGWDAEQMIAGIPGVLNLAAAAQMDLARASDIVTDSMTPFGMAAEEAGRASDVFAKAQAITNTDVIQLGDAMRYAAPNAAAFGMTLEDTAAALGVLAQGGLKGSIGGTALNAMLRDIKKNAENGAIAIGKTKVAITEADGSYRSYEAIMRDVAAATAGMSESQRDAALETVFGDEAIKGVNLTLKQGIGYLEETTAALYECEGTAQDMANTANDNLKGDLAALTSAIGDTAISLSDYLTPALRSGTQFITGLVGRFNSLDSSTKNLIFRAGAMAAAAGPLLLVGGKLLTTFSGLVAPLGLVAAGLTAAYNIFPEFAGVIDSGVDAVQDFGRSLLDGESITEAFTSAVTRNFGSDALGAIISFKTSSTRYIGDAVNTIKSGAISMGDALRAEAAAIKTDWSEGGTLGALAGFGERMADHIREALPAIGEAALGIRDKIGEGISAGVEWFAPRARTMLGNLGTALSNAKDYATEHLPVVRDAIADGLQVAKTTLVTKAQDAMTWIGEAYRSDEVQGLLGDLSGVATTIAGKISVTKEQLIGKAGELLQRLGEALGTDEAKAKVTAITGVVATIAGNITSTTGAWQATATVMITDLVTQLTDNGFLTTLLGDDTHGLGGVVTAIAGGIGTAASNIASAASDIGGALIGALTADDGKLISDLFTNASTVVSALGSKIVDAAGDIATSATSLATRLLGGLNDIDWATLGTQAGIGLSGIAGSLLDSIVAGALAVIADAGPLVDAIGAGIGNAGEALGSAAGVLVEGIVTYLLTPDNWQKLLTVGASLGSAILRGMGSISAGISATAVEIVGGITSAIAGPIAEQFGFNIEQSIGEQLAGINLGASPTTLEQLRNAYNEYGQAMQDGIADQYDRASWLANEKVVGLFAVMVDSQTTETEKIKAAAVLQLAGYGELINNSILGSSEDFFAKMQDLAGEALAGTNDEIKGAADALAASYPGAIQTGLESGIPILQAAADKVAQIASGTQDKVNTLSDAKAVGEESVKGVAEGEEDQVGEVETATQGVSDAITGTLKPLPGLMEALSENGVDGMSAAINQKSSDVTVAMSGLSSDAMQAAAGQMSYGEGYNIGVSTIDGIIGGVASRAGALANRMRELARSAVNAAKRALDINSPSGVMAREVGAWLPGGIGVGVARHMQDALGPLDEVRRSMVSVFDNTLGSVRLGTPDVPWAPAGGYDGGTPVVHIEITGDWQVRSDDERDDIVDALYERISEERRRW